MKFTITYKQFKIERSNKEVTLEEIRSTLSKLNPQESGSKWDY